MRYEKPWFNSTTNISKIPVPVIARNVVTKQSPTSNEIASAFKESLATTSSDCHGRIRGPAMTIWYWFKNFV